jgi:hypothetical protein
LGLFRHESAKNLCEPSLYPSFTNDRFDPCIHDLAMKLNGFAVIRAPWRAIGSVLVVFAGPSHQI